MHITLLTRRPQEKQFTLTAGHLAAGLLVLLILVVSGALVLTKLLLRFGSEIPAPFLQHAITYVKESGAGAYKGNKREDVALMMLKLGDMQARMTRLDSLGQRVQHLAGVSPEAFNFNETPGRGGYERAGDHRAVPDLSLRELRHDMDSLAVDIEHRVDYLSAVEAALMDRRTKLGQLSFTYPVSGGIHSSPYGLRADPFTGRAAFHEGLDLAAPEGTQILAVASGVVINAGQHEQYGNMIDISHGNEIVTRYAHAARLRVRLGDIVRQGQHIADLGSTGRSTGAHLHFEVLVGNLSHDPQPLLDGSSSKDVKLAVKGAN